MQSTNLAPLTLHSLEDMRLNFDISIPIPSPTVPHPLLEFSFKDVSFTALSNKKRKQILHGVTGKIKSGQVIALMGGSGAGKSTLLNLLAGRIGNGKIGGEILINSLPRDPSTWQKLCAYVEQDDVMFANLTVEETLMYSALLRLPKRMSLQEKKQRVDDVILELGLTGCRGTRIGSVLERGISGGERKRVSIGIEMVTQPHILFLDEPTSGLDSFTALNIIDTIKKIAVRDNKIVLMTIHQPRTDILNLFDKVLLLSAGKQVWFGSTQDALIHFEQEGYKLPPQTNPSDFFLDTVTLDQRTLASKLKSNDALQTLNNSWKSKEFTQVSPTKPYAPKLEFDSMDSITWFTSFCILFKRQIIDTLRDKPTMMTLLVQGAIITLMLGFIYYRVSNNLGGIQNRLGVLFFVALNQVFEMTMPPLRSFPMQRPIIMRERMSGSYNASAGFLAKVFAALPFTLCSALIQAIPVYWMIGLQPVTEKYFTFIAIMLVNSFVSQSLGFAIASGVDTIMTGEMIGTLFVVLFALFGGVLVNLNQIPGAIKWIQWISPLTYTIKALVQNEFTGLIVDCRESIGACDPNGVLMIAPLALAEPSLWICVAINGGFIFLFTAVGLILFTKASAPTLRLK